MDVSMEGTYLPDLGEDSSRSGQGGVLTVGGLLLLFHGLLATSVRRTEQAGYRASSLVNTSVKSFFFFWHFILCIFVSRAIHEFKIPTIFFSL